jgi:hypothetical protein
MIRLHKYLSPPLFTKSEQLNNGKAIVFLGLFLRSK